MRAHNSFQMLKEIPAGHLGDATDIANVVSFLASKESHYITGQSVSSGQSE